MYIPNVPGGDLFLCVAWLVCMVFVCFTPLYHQQLVHDVHTFITQNIAMCF